LFFEFRFIGIVYPLRSKFLREKKHVILITMIVWVFSLVCAAPNLIYLRVVTNKFPSRRSCQLIYSEESPQKNQQGYVIHKTMESIIFYFLPLLLQIYCYSRIARRLFYVDETLQTSFRIIGRLSSQRTQVDYAFVY
jgi:thyrotropin-releasing hormone receptor